VTDKLRVRTYNVRFGDAVLVTIPDRDPATGETTRRNILFDVGNALNKEGGKDAVFAPVVKDIVKELRGRPLDLYVMTHEHLDHVQGLFYASKQEPYADDELKQKLNVHTAWLTASAARDYYDTHPNAKRKSLQLAAAYDRIAEHLKSDSLPARQRSYFEGLLANNDTRTTSKCVDYLRNLASEVRTHYVSKDFDVTGKHPFRETRFEIWAPEEDTSKYYLNLTPLALSAADAGGVAWTAARPLPPPGVDAGAFYDLVDARASGIADNLLAIDKAANNTSLVICIEWRGWRLLFTGDAELESWEKMDDAGLLKAVDFLKVSHHGSHNGTPDPEILDKVLPLPGNGRGKARAVVSTWEDAYPGIPHDPTDAKIKKRATLRSTLKDRDKLYLNTYFSG
jgi:hypothetical protein